MKNLTIALFFAAGMTCPVVWAAIDYSETPEGLSISAVDETNASILDGLARYLGFEYELKDPDWASVRRHFSAGGDPESIIRRFLSGENYIIGYRGDGKGGKSNIRLIVLLPEGDGIAYSPAPAETPNGEALAGDESTPDKGVGVAKRAKYRPLDSERSVAEIMTEHMSYPAFRKAKPSNQPTSPAVMARATSLPSSVPPAQQKELEALTLQAHRDVKELVQALKTAEESMQSTSGATP